MFRVLILGVIAATLTGCASPHYSMRDSEQYYRASRAYVRSPAYYDAGWYPWWSMEYFYLGSHHYRPGYGGSFSFGLFPGYPYYDPWYFPGYYSAWYAPYGYYDPWYGGYYGRGFGYSRYYPYRHHGDRGHDDRSPRDEYSGAGDSGGVHTDRRRHDYRRPWEVDRAGLSDPGRPEPQRTSRNVSVAPSGGGRDRGMVIISRGDSKIGPSRTGPVSGNKVVRSSSPAPSVRGNPGSAAARSRSRWSNPDDGVHAAGRYSVPVSPPPNKSGKKGDRR